MRYDKQIMLVTNGTDIFNPTTGDYETTDPTYTNKWANVTDMSQDTQTFLFGGLKEGAYTVRLQGHVMQKFDHIRMDGKDYNIRSQRVLRRFTVLKVSEKQ